MTEVKGETYASFKFVWKDNNGHLADGAAYVGKGIRGVKALGPEYEHNAKLFEIVGANGKSVRFDLRSSGKGSSVASFLNAKGKLQFTIPLNADPYAVFLDSIADEGADEHTVALHVEQGFTTLRMLDMVRRQLTRHADRVLVYPGGMRASEKLPEGRPAPWVEELETILPSVMGGNGEKK